MKKNLFLSLIAILLLAACQQTPEPVTVDLEAEEAAAREMFSLLRDAMNGQNIETLFSFFTEDALIIGSDPKEIMNKEEIKKAWIELSEAIEFKFVLFGEQLFKMDPDGNSAVAVSHFYVPTMTANLPLRQVFLLSKVEDKWMVTFWSSSVVPKNEDLGKIIEALAEEE